MSLLIFSPDEFVTQGEHTHRTPELEPFRCTDDTLRTRGSFSIEQPPGNGPARTPTGSSGSTCTPQTVTRVDVPVHFHLIRRDNGEGGITRSMARTQLTVLNEAFAPYGFHFVYGGFTITNNTAWHAMTPGSAEESEAKTRLRVGDADTLNVYYAGTDGGLLGWATFPWWYQSDPTDDGVVVMNETLPGGAAEPNNSGAVLVHEVGHWLGLCQCSAGGDMPEDNKRVFDCEPRQERDGFQSCTTPFSTGPSSHMHDAWKNYRR